MARRNQDRRRSCIGKDTYRSLGAAVEVAGRMLQEVLFCTQQMDAYRCRHGQHYHMGTNRSDRW